MKLRTRLICKINNEPVRLIGLSTRKPAILNVPYVIQYYVEYEDGSDAWLNPDDVEHTAESIDWCRAN